MQTSGLSTGRAGSTCFVRGRVVRSIGNPPPITVPCAQKKGRDQDPDGRKGLDDVGKARSNKGNSFEKLDRRRGRPAHLRSPDDTPLRDANRDFMLGVLTARAARTLIQYFTESNDPALPWLTNFVNENAITLSGTWEDISGDTFLRKMLSAPSEELPLSLGSDEVEGSSSDGDMPSAESGPAAAAAAMPSATAAAATEQPSTGQESDDEPKKDGAAVAVVDPRALAERILEIRASLAKEFKEDLSLVPEDNNDLLRQSLMASYQGAAMFAPLASGDADDGAASRPK